MNPFGFVVGPNFSSSGLTSFSLLATDALSQILLIMFL